MEVIKDGVDTAPDFSRGPQAILAALRDESNSEAAFLKLLDQSPLEDGQRAVVDLLLSLGADDMDTSVAGGTDGSVNDVAENEGSLELDDIRLMLNELHDLREVNDTLARALGACRLCWGGGEECDECGGRGWPGSSIPDASLFRELVAPAVDRAHAITRATRPGGRGTPFLRLDTTS